MNTNSEFHPFINSIFSNTAYQFWFLQLMYWFGLSVISFVSLTLWYASADWQQVTHTLLQSIEGLIISLALHWVFTVTWDKKQAIRFSITIFSILAAATVWTGIRMLTFMILIDSKDLWRELGGWYFSSIFVFLGWSALYYGFTYYKLLQIEHERSLQAENLAKEAQLKMLRYQLNPHFLFNTLNAISALIKLREASKAQGMLQELSQFLRFSLDTDPVKPITLAQEIEILSLYLNIEEIRFTDRLKVRFALSKEANQALVPSFLLQPLIENSIKYAIAPSEEGGLISVNARVAGLEKNQLHITISDSGPGMETSHIEANKTRGVGLRNTLERLKVAYPNNYSFATRNVEPQGLEIRITIPYETEAMDYDTSNILSRKPVLENGNHHIERPF